MTKDIYAPVTGEKVQIGQQINSFSISISDDLLSSIKMSRVCLSFSRYGPLLTLVFQFEDNEVGFVTGRVVTHANSTIPTFEPVSSSVVSTDPDETATRGTRLLGSRVPAALPNSTMIGELKLTALKARLTSIGVQAELIGEGVLICGGKRGAVPDPLQETVAVRKTAKGKVELEGNVSPVYYTVRKEIYNLHALVTA